MTPRLSFAIRTLAYAWAAPNSVIGLALGIVACVFGARMQIREGALEFGGGRLGRLVAGLPAPFCFSAITFGHVILGVSLPALAAVRAHEQVHVRQYQRWGPFFLPAYVGSSLIQLARGRHPYLDNHFEREAYAKAPGVVASTSNTDKNSPA